jgi:4-amino-4-deoxy-L-arabinose transferase-like glycosyltransferase
MITQTPKADREGRLLCLILTVALLLRLLLAGIVIAHPERSVAEDTDSYVSSATHLLEHGSLEPTVMRTPLYPTYLAVHYSLAGIGNVTSVMISQALLGTLAVWMTWRLGLLLLQDRRAALLAAALLALSVEMIGHGGYVITEILFVVIELGALLAWVNHSRGGSLSWLAGCGLLLGLAILCRPIAIILPPIIVFCTSLPLLLERRWAQVFRNGACLCMPCAVVLVPWLMHAQRTLGFTTLSTVSHYNALYYNAASVMAYQQGRSVTEVREDLDKQLPEELARRNWVDDESHRARLMQEMGEKVVRENLPLFIALHLKQDLNSLLPDVTTIPEMLGLSVGGKGTLAVLNHAGLLAAVRHYFGGNLWLVCLAIPSVIMLGFTYLGAAWAAQMLVRQRCWLALAVLLAVTAAFLLVPGAPSMHRFRVPVMPQLCLMAGAGWTAFLSWWRQRTT